ncbi:MAG: phosphopantothenoylcysteine decarboxylase, partial [Actinobacteria bacterium]|nr:phosphopantothenoylcysteine decarboxylase [Actinomycetota bacterium]
TDPAGVKVVRVGTASQLREAVLKAAAHADAVVMAAAVADFRPAVSRPSKIKKTGTEPDPVALVVNPDVLAELVRYRPPGQVVVGFAAETGDSEADVLTHGRAKLARKGCDLMVVNAVGEGRAFEIDQNTGWLLGDDGAETALPEGPKSLLASYVWDAVVARLTR